VRKVIKLHEKKGRSKGLRNQCQNSRDSRPTRDFLHMSAKDPRPLARPITPSETPEALVHSAVQCCFLSTTAPCGIPELGFSYLKTILPKGA
jgi:hypothetical protein